MESEKILTNNLGLRMVKALPFIHHPDRVARKARDMSVADWRYQTREKISYFSGVVTVFPRAGNSCVTS